MDGEIFCVTLENPWKKNVPKISCIPIGLYKVERKLSPRWGDSFQVMDVDGRTHIVIHNGNVEANTLGCILLGRTFGELDGEPAVLISKPTVKKFMEKMKGIDSFSLKIILA
jgi:hypothetical protein